MKRVYFLAIKEVIQRENELRQLLDKERLDKADRYRSEADRARSLAAGLLLQYGVQEYQAKARWNREESESDYVLEELTALEICQKLTAPLLLHYHYGADGKPYLEEGPFFSLSHSGEYAACAIAEQEIGLDIQQEKAFDSMKLAKRFFSETEQQELAKCPPEEREKLFYYFWTRKEAYGKLTGRGLKDGLHTDTRQEAIRNGVCFAELLREGYQAALCWYE